MERGEGKRRGWREKGRAVHCAHSRCLPSSEVVVEWMSLE